MGAVGDCVQYKEEVKSAIEELINNSKEVQAEAEKILDTESLLQAQQLLLHHQVGQLLMSISNFLKITNLFNYNILLHPLIQVFIFNIERIIKEIVLCGLELIYFNEECFQYLLNVNLFLFHMGFWDTKH